MAKKKKRKTPRPYGLRGFANRLYRERFGKPKPFNNVGYRDVVLALTGEQMSKQKATMWLIEKMYEQGECPRKPTENERRKFLARPAGRAKPENFYKSPSWRMVRYSALEKANGACQCCGARGGFNGVVLHVDHIKPRSRFPELELDPDNLQVLCEDCNLGKSNRYETDWRA